MVKLRSIIGRASGRRTSIRASRYVSISVGPAVVVAMLAVPTAASAACAPVQLLGNPSFETGTAPWVASPGVIMRATNSYRPLDGSYIARFAAEGTTNTDTLAQTVTLPTGCTTYRFQYWLAIDSNELSLFARDTLTLQVLDSAGNVLATPHRWSNLNETLSYVGKSTSLAAYAGRTVTLKFTSSEDSSYWTSFRMDKTSVTVS